MTTLYRLHFFRSLNRIITRNYWIQGYKLETSSYEMDENVSLEEVSVKDPYVIFTDWFKSAQKNLNILNPSVMCLATATKNGQPSIRLMLCESHSDYGFVFSTCHTSRKGEELRENPRATISFFWSPLAKAVTIEGHVERLPHEISDVLFANNSFSYRINAHCSTQKYPIEHGMEMIRREVKMIAQYSLSDIPRPYYFGWYVLKPTYMEFWQVHKRKERMRFRKPVKDEVPDKMLTHQGEKGWLYEIMEP